MLDIGKFFCWMSIPISIDMTNYFVNPENTLFLSVEHARMYRKPLATFTDCEDYENQWQKIN
jgi:hypothetical protein